MAYDIQLASRVRTYLAGFPKLKIKEKKMFGGLAFLVNGKMCVNISDQNLMCRFDPLQTEELTAKKGFLPMIMKGKKYNGYCYIEPIGIKNKNDFIYWMNICLNYNGTAKASKKSKKQ